MACMRDLLKDRVLYFITPGQSVAEAAGYMSERNVGAVCVLEKNRLVGILSERDILTRLVAAHRDPQATKVAEVMTARPVVVDAHETCEKCLQVMKRAGVRHLPVVEGDRLVGLLALRDLLQVDRDEKAEEVKLMEDYIHYVPPSKPQL
ncbi:CBS domain-containing protein [Acidobacteriia bacterium AH_259_A11_L15]|nr:CBS domain-containing protein [Acidobacteriia bacterium AH_259_A11_L15]